jgi:hypothetical protein
MLSRRRRSRRACRSGSAEEHVERQRGRGARVVEGEDLPEAVDPVPAPGRTALTPRLAASAAVASTLAKLVATPLQADVVPDTVVKLEPPLGQVALPTPKVALVTLWPDAPILPVLPMAPLDRWKQVWITQPPDLMRVAVARRASSCVFLRSCAVSPHVSFTHAGHPRLI